MVFKLWIGVLKYTCTRRTENIHFRPKFILLMYDLTQETTLKNMSRTVRDTLYGIINV